MAESNYRTDLPPTPEGQGPFILAVSTTQSGHFTPVLQMVQHLVQHGHDVTFLTATANRAAVEKVGAAFAALAPEVDYADDDFKNAGQPGRHPIYEGRFDTSPGLQRAVFDISVMIRSIPGQAASVTAALDRLQGRDPRRNVVLLAEVFFLGAMALKLGAGGPDFPPVVGVNVVPLALGGPGLAPYGAGKSPDTSWLGAVRNALLKAVIDATALNTLNRLLKEQLVATGATDPRVANAHMELQLLYQDVLLQMSVPSLEYPRPDLPPHVRFAGNMPARPTPPDYPYPAWWGDIISNGKPRPEGTVENAAPRKKVVAVTQGTLNPDWSELLLPTLRALAPRGDVLVVAILGSRGATLPADFALPPNARVADFLPYDAVLGYADAWVHNAGYGAIAHGAANGVPMVLAPGGEEKPEGAARAAYAGVAVNLATGRPTSAALARAVGEVLADPKFKVRAMEIRAEVERHDPLGMVETEICRCGKAPED